MIDELYVLRVIANCEVFQAALPKHTKLRDNRLALPVELAAELGKKVLSVLEAQKHPVGEFNVDINLSNLQDGLYICNFIDNGNILSKKVIIIH